MPAVTSQSVPTVRGAVKVRCSSLPSAADHQHRRLAALVTRDRLLRHQYRLRPGTFDQFGADEHTGSSSRFGLGKAARIAWLPVAGSTVTSANLSVPVCG